MIQASEYGKIFNDRLNKGAFLNTSNGQKANTMTVSWGSIGIMWGAPTVTIMVRQTRYSKENLNTIKAFTLSVPMDDSYQDALALCGSKSGRDIDKYAAAGITPQAPKTGIVPVIGGGPFLQIECSVVYERNMDLACLNPAERKTWYGDTEHTFYIGKINAVYTV